MTSDNHLLGKFNLDGIAPAPRGVPQIEVSFDLDANGILTVSASDKGSGKASNITISNEKGRLSKDEVDRLIKEAEKHKESDEQRRMQVESKNNFEQYVYQVQGAIKDEKIKEKLTEAERTLINSKCDELQQWLHANQNASKNEYEEKRQELETVYNPIATKIFG